MGSAEKSESTRPAEPIASLPVEALRWRCDPQSLAFETTADVEPIVGVIGQDSAVDALRFGLQTQAPGQNIFVRGLSGTGRMTLLKRLLEEIRLVCPATRARCYVHNFSQPDRPRLITLPRGTATGFRKRVEHLADFIRDDLGEALSSENIKTRRNVLDKIAEQEMESVVKPFQEALKEAGLALVTIQAGPMTQTAIYPLHEGEPVPPEQFDQLHTQGKLSDEAYQAARQRHDSFEQQFAEVNEKVGEIRRKNADDLQNLLEKAARWILEEPVKSIETEFPEPSVQAFLTELVDDVVNQQLGDLEKDDDFTSLYRVNVVLEHQGDACPIVIENAPTMRNLLGAVEYDFTQGEQPRANHLGVRGGSILRADGGYLILEARDVLAEPGSWRALVRTLRSGRLEIVPSDSTWPWMGPSLKPEAIDVSAKVILMGEADTYYLLDEHDADFPHLFKLLADFDTTIPRDQRSVNDYARVLARIASDEQLPPFERAAVAALTEHGARIADRKQKLTARFGQLADVAREAAFIAGKAGRKTVSADNVRETVRRRKSRADLPARKFREYVTDGTIRVQVSGTRIGQINGLAVLSAGPLVYGFPARITATIGPGTAGVINIEREAHLSGAIHTKGFYIVGGLLRTLLNTDHPLAFNASLAFEQSYGGIDGDSASGAEFCCLLSALTAVPLRQDLALTGAIDQHGRVLPIGGVNEKIEGFFDTCRDIGLTGTQGVLIPQANAGDLMLREDVVEACGAAQFHIHAIETIHQALGLLTGIDAGARDAAGAYPEGSVLGRAVEKARAYWLMAAPPTPAPSGPADDAS